MIGGSYMGGISEAEKSEADGFYFLRWRASQYLYGGDMGRGSSENMKYFKSEDAREYFIQLEREKERHAITALKLMEAEDELKKIADKREARRARRAAKESQLL